MMRAQSRAARVVPRLCDARNHVPRTADHVRDAPVFVGIPWCLLMPLADKQSRALPKSAFSLLATSNLDFGAIICLADREGKQTEAPPVRTASPDVR